MDWSFPDLCHGQTYREGGQPPAGVALAPGFRPADGPDPGCWHRRSWPDGAFALVFIPPWVAFRLASSWRVCLTIGVGLGVFTYGIAFATALVLDQPFGPVLVAISIRIGLLALAAGAQNGR